MKDLLLICALLFVHIGGICAQPLMDNMVNRLLLNTIINKEMLHLRSLLEVIWKEEIQFRFAVVTNLNLLMAQR